MARKSAADLTVVPLSGGGRPPPPAGLDATEQAAWTAVVDASSSFVLDPAAQLILRSLSAQTALCERATKRACGLCGRSGPADDEELTALARSADHVLAHG